MKILKPAELEALAVSGHSWQPDENQTNRGTVYSRCWSGENAPVVTPNMTLPLIIQRDPDQGALVDEAIPFGLAVTISMPGEVALYDEARARAAHFVRAPAAPALEFAQVTEGDRQRNAAGRRAVITISPVIH